MIIEYLNYMPVQRFCSNCIRPSSARFKLNEVREKDYKTFFAQKIKPHTTALPKLGEHSIGT